MTLRDLTPAALAGCCFAASKEECKRPPCPCNLQCWSPQEIHDLAMAKAKVPGVPGDQRQAREHELNLMNERTR